VQTTGEVTAAVAGAARDVEVRISPFLLPRLAAHEEAALREVEMTGDAELAHEISFLARHLSWDYEEDLSRAIGDIAAHRVAEAGRGFARWARQAGQRTSQSAAEYWTEENPLIASRVKVEGFVRDVSELRDAVERLEKRLELLDR
jgi:ubiquinone biosynthesis protein UbiJ